jgi:DNA repair exonuclease SbcCD ATPase subunit
MNTLAKASLALLALPIGLYALAGRPVSHLLGLTRAGADVAVERGLDQVPTVVHDRKLDNDLALQSRQLTEHQLSLNLSRRELETLRTQVDDLQDRSERRQRLLAEAYPVLQAAMADGRDSVEFAGNGYTLAEFQADIDRLLTEQERDERQLDIRRAGLGKLTASITEGERALSDMRDSLLALEQEVELLRTRREQARLESQTLELVSAVQTGPRLDASGVAQEAAQLRTEVDTLEARNEARRTALPSGVTPTRLAEDWARLERLKSIHAATAAPEAAPLAPESSLESVDDPEEAVNGAR